MTIKKSFTLFELLIVVSIIGLVYSLFTQKLNVSKKAKSATLKTIVPWVMKQTFSKQASIVCLVDEKDDGCRFYLDSEIQKDTRFRFFKKFDEVRVYKLNNNNFSQVEFFPILEGEIRMDVFFRFDISSNGGFATNVLNKNDTYFLYNSHNETKLFNSLADIKDYLWEQKKILQESF